MITHYSKGIKTRAQDKRNTYYLAPHGAKCPIGRLLTQIELEIILDWLNDPTNIATSVSAFYDKNKDKFPSLHKYPDGFLRDIQRWHDTDECWDEKGISEYGMSELEKIKFKVSKMKEHKLDTV